MQSFSYPHRSLALPHPHTANASRSFGAPLVMLAVLATLALSCATSSTPLSSREFKLLLNAERFAQPDEALHAYWSLVEAVALERGLVLKPSYQGWKEKQRQVTFFDSSDGLLRSHKLVLRQRIKRKGGALQDKVELTLKYRDEDPSRAALAQTRAAHGPDDTLMEEDVLPIAESLPCPANADAPLRSLYSKRSKTELLTVPAPELGAFATLFPLLGELGASPPLESVVYEESTYSPADLVLSPTLRVEPTLTLWRAPDGAISVAEFSFSYLAKDATPGAFEPEVLAFFGALRCASADWLGEARSKSSISQDVIQEHTSE
ncbi:MAG: hypothetical protein RBU37_05160 [Myxococcota bacterium]|jgi:hypothetical protein|nr:hypothetical protein [Myxococcota bacterium]